MDLCHQRHVWLIDWRHWAHHGDEAEGGVAIMEYQNFVEWAFMAAITGAAWLAVSAIQGIREEVGRIQSSVSDLNSSVKVVLDRTERHEEKLEHFDERLRVVEMKSHNVS